MIAGSFLPAHRAVDTAGCEPAGQVRAEQQVVEAQAGIALLAHAAIVPEGVERLLRVELAQRVGPAAADQPPEGGAAIRMDQRVVGATLKSPASTTGAPLRRSVVACFLSRSSQASL